MLPMSLLRRNLAKGLCLVASSLVLAPGAVAQNFPTKALKIVVPNAAGGAADITARTVGQKLGEALGQKGALVDFEAMQKRLDELKRTAVMEPKRKFKGPLRGLEAASGAT